MSQHTDVLSCQTRMVTSTLQVIDHTPIVKLLKQRTSLSQSVSNAPYSQGCEETCS